MQEIERKLSSKRWKQTFGTLEIEKTEQNIEALDNAMIFEIDYDNVQLPIVLIYNSVWEYFSTIHELESHQTFLVYIWL